MNKPRRLWPVIAVALIGLPVLYVASFGPACWIYGRSAGIYSPELPRLYAPIGEIMDRFRDSAITEALYAYGCFGARHEVQVILFDDTVVSINPSRYMEEDGGPGQPSQWDW